MLRALQIGGLELGKEMVIKDGPGTDIYFVPYGIIAGLVLGWYALQGGLRPVDFWGTEAGGFFLSALSILAMKPRNRQYAHYAMVALTMIGAAGWFLRMTPS